MTAERNFHLRNLYRAMTRCHHRPSDIIATTSIGSHSKSESPKVPFAACLRGIAALSVLLGHYLGVFWFWPAGQEQITGMPPPDDAAPWLSNWVIVLPIDLGPFGVALFFIISGFVIPFSFQRYGALRFLIGRFLRIFPTFWFGLAISLCFLFAATRIVGAPFPHTARELAFGFALGLRDVFWVPSIDGIVWTLEVELKFYVVCAAAAPLLRSRSPFIFLVPVALFALATYLAAALVGTTSTRLFFIAFSAPYLIFMFIGIAFHFLYAGTIGRAQALLLVSAIFCMFSWSISIGEFREVGLWRNYAPAVAAFAITMRFPSIVTKLPAASFWSDISYPVYIIHALVGYSLMAVLLHFRMPSWLVVIAAFVIVTAIATAVHLWIEAPFIALNKRLRLRKVKNNSRSLVA